MEKMISIYLNPFYCLKLHIALFHFNFYMSSAFICSLNPLIQQHIGILTQYFSILHHLRMLIITVHPLFLCSFSITVVVPFCALDSFVHDYR
jgi:hypothetical protein